MEILNTKNVYSEVFELLKFTNREDLKKVPVNLLETIKENKNNKYVPTINLNDINTSISSKARSLYIWIYLTYISKDDKEKDEITKVLQANQTEIKEEIKLNENIFNTEPKDKQEIKNEQLVIRRNILIRNIVYANITKTYTLYYYFQFYL